jgi:hypothetical protein
VAEEQGIPVEWEYLSCPGLGGVDVPLGGKVLSPTSALQLEELTGVDIDLVTIYNDAGDSFVELADAIAAGECDLGRESA